MRLIPTIFLFELGGVLPAAAEPPHSAGWSWEPGVAGPIGLVAVLFFVGLARTRRRAQVPWARVLSFCAGWLALVIALNSPIHALAEQVFWMHMIQHELLMVVAAPLLVAAQPLTIMLWAMPLRWRQGLASFFKLPALAASWWLLSSPLVAWLLHAAALWLWHVPSLFSAALEMESVHALQHFCFLGSALLFWWTLLQGRHGRMGYGAALIYVFTTAAHNSALSALLVFSTRPWYPHYVSISGGAPFTALEDQQLGGLIMWIPAGTLLFIIALALLAGWIREGERRFAYTRTAALIRGESDA
jgi:putative membrane protein